jgi:Flp pilus assembly protein TadD
MHKQAGETLQLAFDAEPRSLAAHLTRAAWQERDGNRKDALETLRAAARFHPTDASVWSALGTLQWRAGSRDDAEQSFLKALAVSGNGAAVHRTLAGFYLGTGRADRAESHLRATAGATPADRLRLAEYYMAANRFDEADGELESLLKAGALKGAARLRRAQIRRAQQRIDEAYEAVRAAATDRAVAFDAAMLETEMLIADGKLDDALERAREAAEMEPRRAEGSYAVAAIYARRGDVRQSEEWFRRTRELTKRPAMIDLELAKLALADNRPAEAVRLAKHVASDLPGAESHVFLALAHLANDDATEASRVLTAAQRRWASHPGVARMVGMLKQEHGERAAARVAYERALALNPSDGVAANNLAWLYAESGRVQEALKLAERARAALGNAPQVLDTSGWVSHLAGRTDDALHWMRAALEKAPDNPTYHWHLGAIYLEAGKPAEARASLTKALAISTSFDGADDVRRALATLK